MQMLRVGDHQVSPASIVRVEGGYRVKLQTCLLVAVILLAMAPFGPTIRIVLGLAAFAVVVIEGYAYFRDRLTVRVILRDRRMLVLPCLSERDLQLTLSRIRNITPVVELKRDLRERAFG